MRITLAQQNPIVGDLKGNLELLRRAAEIATRERSDLLILPEMFLTGYPPRDLLKRNWFLQMAEKALAEVRELSCRTPFGILLGGVVRANPSAGEGVYNAAFLFEEGREVFRQPKSALSTLNGFDETRYFLPAPEIRVVTFREMTLGVAVGDVFWRSKSDPLAQLARLGAQVFIIIAASPFSVGKPKQRFQNARTLARTHQRPLVFLNMVGGNDQLVFDGNSFILDPRGEPVFTLPGFEEGLTTIHLKPPFTPLAYEPPEDIRSVYQALVLGVRDYCRKCGFSRAVLGLSGGIDSAVTCCIAVAALGKDRVLGVMMPSEFTAPSSIADARQLAENLGIELLTIPITPVFHSYLQTLKPFFAGKPPDVTEENIQARIRGNILMALSNKFGYLVLGTGNKSELAVGYCTLYGDMSGGLAVLSDILKTTVYELARHINREREIIPRTIIEKPPSAELRPGQKDQDTLPPYPILDRIVALYVEEGLSPEEIVRQGLQPEVVEWVIREIHRNEYKRQQAPLGISISPGPFGGEHRYPIAARYIL